MARIGVQGFRSDAQRLLRSCFFVVRRCTVADFAAARAGLPTRLQRGADGLDDFVLYSRLMGIARFVAPYEQV